MAGTGKTTALREVAGSTGAPLVNVNLELSRRMLDLAERQRPLRVRRLLDRIVAKRGRDVVLLDNIEILFDATLRQHPLRLLQGLSRSRVVAAAWNGFIEDGHVHYAAPGHPEYRRYPLNGILVVRAEAEKRPASGWNGSSVPSVCSSKAEASTRLHPACESGRDHQAPSPEVRRG